MSNTNMIIAHQNIKKQIPVNKIVIAHQNIDIIDGLKKSGEADPFSSQFHPTRYFIRTWT